MTLLDPTYAIKYIPIIASVSEHQPAIWSNYITDLHVAVFFMPAGIFLCFWRRSYGLLFLGLFGLISTYFSGVMIRLLLVMSPAACCLSGIGVSHAMSVFASNLRARSVPSTAVKHTRLTSLVGVAALLWILLRYVTHCTHISSSTYSSPSIVMASRDEMGNKVGKQ